LLYFVGNDPGIPENIRREAQQWGLCKDEFADTGHWPHQLYVRVARRMLGQYVMTQHDLEKDTVKYDGIGMGSYNIDVRHVQRTFQWISRFPELRGETFNEGYLSIPVAPYEIPYRALVPKYEQCTNLLVPVCVSSSNLAYASIRMEPQYMIMGHAAGVAAALAGKGQLPVQQVDIAALRQKLRAQGQVLSLEGNLNGVFGQGNTVVVDDDMSRWVEKNGAWAMSEDPQAARHDITYLYTSSQEPASLTYQPPLPQDGLYKVYGWWPSGKDFATNAPLSIRHAEGTKTVALNQRETGGNWVLLGSYRFKQGFGASLTLSNEQADGTVIADAFKFDLVK
jgi:hypothetical protein